MTGVEFNDYIRYKTRADTATFPIDELLSYANVVRDSLALRIEGVNEDYFGSPETTPLLVTSSTREYPFPADMLNRIKLVEAKFDGTNWVRLDELDLNEYKRTTDNTTIEQNFANEEGKAFFDIFRGSLWLYTGEVTAEVDAGLQLLLFTYPAKLTADGTGSGDDATLGLDSTDELSFDPSTTTHGFPRSFHEVWADGVIIKYKDSKDKPIPLTERESSHEFFIQQALNAIKGTNRDRALIANVPDDDECDDGFEH